ncbi:MAG: hypothetical protein ABGX16_03250 [Pirellulales bacterium]
MERARISHTFLLRVGQVLAWLRQTAQFDLQCINNTFPVKLLVFLASQGLTTARDEKCEKSRLEVMDEMVGSLFAESNRLCADRSRNYWAFFWLPLMIALVGCGSNLPKLYPVSGTVTLDGEPLAAGHVLLYLDGAGGGMSQDAPNGVIQDGKYEILTGKRSGASAGSYKVVVKATNYSGDAPPMVGTAVPIRSLIDVEYSNPSQTPLVLEVVTEPRDGAYDFEVTKQGGSKR